MCDTASCLHSAFMCGGNDEGAHDVRIDRHLASAVRAQTHGFLDPEAAPLPRRTADDIRALTPPHNARVGVCVLLSDCIKIFAF